MLFFGEAPECHRRTIGFKAKPREYDETVPVTVTGAYHERWVDIRYGHLPITHQTAHGDGFWVEVMTMMMKGPT